jgi:hypothetical protein
MKNLVLSSKNQKRNNLVEFIIKHKNTFVDIVAALYILLFLYTAISKSFNIAGTVVVLKKVPFLGKYALEIAWVVVISEYLAALLLFVPRYRKIGLNISLVLMAAFTSYIVCVNSCHVDPGFLHDDPPRLSAIRVRA